MRKPKESSHEIMQEYFWMKLPTSQIIQIAFTIIPAIPVLDGG